MRSGQLGTSGNNMQKYVTVGDPYSYADAEPASYNALLSASSYNGSDHGYINFKAKVPVEAGIYKITLGTCQFGTGTGYVKNADESSTLNITDENGQTVTSFNQNTGACYHNNTTSNVVSVWYTASSDETITVVCGSYTPYFAIEKVNAVPELQYTVTYANNTTDVEGIVPSVASITAGNSVTLPVNRTLYKDGYTLTGWSDGTTTYEPGTNYTPTANVTLNAVFSANTVSLNDRTAATTIKWSFRRDEGAPIVQWEGNNHANHIWVTQATVAGSTIDVKMSIDASSGKFNNASNTDCTQTNSGTTFVIPSYKNAVVELQCHGSFTISTTTIDGSSTYTTGSGTTTVTYTVTGNTGSSTIVIGDGSYYRYVQVTLPAPQTVDVNVTSALYATYYNGELPLVLPEDLQAATIDGENGGKLTLNWRYGEGDVIPAATPVLLKATTATGYTLTEKIGDTTAAPTGNYLLGSDEATTTSGGGDGAKYYALQYGTGDYYGAADGAAFAIGAHKAWLALPASAGARSFFLLDGETTSIRDAVKSENLKENSVYDLQGRCVNGSEVKPGLYIVNGKKIVIK